MIILGLLDVSATFILFLFTYNFYVYQILYFFQGIVKLLKFEFKNTENLSENETENKTETENPIPKMEGIELIRQFSEDFAPNIWNLVLKMSYPIRSKHTAAWAKGLQCRFDVGAQVCWGPVIPRCFGNESG